MTDEAADAGKREFGSGPLSELTFLGPSNDGKRLLLAGANGERFELPVDNRLIAVVSREYRERVTTPVRPQSELPTPREIQDRIRHGENVEDLASSVGADVDEIARFASPVITERAHIADLAQQSLIPTGTGHRPLIDVVMDRLRVRGIDVHATLWDAWRRPDGRWAVVIAYPVAQGSQVATFVYAPDDKSVDPTDDGARWLLEVPGTGSQEPPTSSQTPRVPAGGDEPTASTPDADSTATPSRPTPPSPQATRGESNGNPNWDKAHPAARAAQRRESTPARPTPTSVPTAPAPAPAPPTAAEPLSEAEAPQLPPGELTPKITTDSVTVTETSSDSPQWEELLFGVPRDDK